MNVNASVRVIRVSVSVRLIKLKLKVKGGALIVYLVPMINVGFVT